VKLPRLPRPNKDGTISQTWLEYYIESRYSFHDENMGHGAHCFFGDLIQMGLINSEKINWDVSLGDEDGQN